MYTELEEFMSATEEPLEVELLEEQQIPAVKDKDYADFT